MAMRPNERLWSDRLAAAFAWTRCAESTRMPDEVIEDAIRQVTRTDSPDLVVVTEFIAAG